MGTSQSLDGTQGGKVLREEEIRAQDGKPWEAEIRIGPVPPCLGRSYGHPSSHMSRGIQPKNQVEIGGWARQNGGSALPPSAQHAVELHDRQGFVLLSDDQVQLGGVEIRVVGEHFKIAG